MNGAQPTPFFVMEQIAPLPNLWVTFVQFTYDICHYGGVTIGRKIKSGALGRKINLNIV